MNVQKQTETDENSRYMQGFYSSITNGFVIPQNNPNINQLMAKPELVQMDGSKRLELSIADLQIGKRIQNELKEQGRSVSWLARQLGMERTSLYYTFRQNSIDLELLMRISFIVGHNFLQDVCDAYKAYGL